jgi:hypothetical protein
MMTQTYNAGPIVLTEVPVAFVLPPGRNYTVLFDDVPGVNCSFSSTPCSMDGVYSFGPIVGGSTIYLWADAAGEYNVQIVSD